jgi:succinate-acetate transporter protein
MPATVTLRPIGNPLPLGFLALAGGTMTVSGLQLGWLEATEGKKVALILLAFVFPLQLLTSIFGFLARDTVAGTGMGILSGTWASIGIVMLTSPMGAKSDALGLLLLVAGAAMLVPALGGLTGKVVAGLVLATAGARFALTGGYELGSNGLKHPAGIVGVVLAGLAFYTALAMTIEDVRRREVLPLGRIGAGRAAMHGGPEAQAELVHREAGVREQL